MTRAATVWLLRRMFRVFFAHADVVGAAHVPRRGPLFIAVNHPSALVDALVMFVLSPRPVTMLAKSTLFTMPLVGQLVRAMGSLPVRHRQDQGGGAVDNLALFEGARAHLERGDALCMFPEGISHDGSQLKPGLARMALGAQALMSPGAVQICPASLFYTHKGTLKSRVLLQFGAPFGVPRVALSAASEPPPEAVRQLTEALARRLAGLTVQPAEPTLLPLLARAAEILDQAEHDAPSLAGREARLARLVEGYRQGLAEDPEALAQLVERVRAYDQALTEVGLPTHDDLGRVPGRLRVALAWPLGLVGIAIYTPAYRAVAALALRHSAGQGDMEATVKVLAGSVLFALTTLVVVLVGWQLLPGWWRAGLLLVPLSGRLGLWVVEAQAARWRRARARRAGDELAAQRRAIHQQLLALGERVRA